MHNDQVDSLLQSLFENMPEDGASFALLQRDGQAFHSSYISAEALTLDRDCWEGIVVRLDDGDDPVVVQTGEVSLVVTLLDHPLADCSYAVLILPQKTMDQVLQRFDLVQMILGHIQVLTQVAHAEACLVA